jgi:hypothetical protein
LGLALLVVRGIAREWNEEKLVIVWSLFSDVLAREHRPINTGIDHQGFSLTEA